MERGKAGLVGKWRSAWTLNSAARTRATAALLAVATAALLAGAWRTDQAHATEATGTFGKTTVGAHSDYFNYERKRVNRYSLPVSATVTKLSIYLAPDGGTSGQQVLKGIVYSDASSKPEAPLGVSEQLTFTSTSAAGWYELRFATPLKLAAGNYWIGVLTGPTAKVTDFRYDEVAGSRDYNANSYSAGPSNPFGKPTVDEDQMSLYASYTTQTASSPPANTAPPGITGTAQQGQTLTETHGTWTNEPTSYSYQWQQCNSLGEGCLPISGAISQTYVPTAADVEHTLRVQETASNSGGASSPASSAQSAVVKPAAPTNTALPAISGSAQEGQTLTASNGSWSGEPTSYAYQWQRCNSSGGSCAAITGATAQTYTAASADVGSTLRVAVTASNSGGASSPASSAQSAVVKPAAPTNTALPAISGSAQEGQTLTASNGSWSGEPTSYAYQWQRCNSSGGSCAAITGATAQTYTAASADVGSTLRVAVTASNSGGASSPATSAQTAVVTAQPSNPVLAVDGDIACPAGDKENSCQQQTTANLLSGQHPTAVATLGDNQYSSGLLSEFNSAGAYNATWGVFNPIVHPAPGNHEYAQSSVAAGYFSYFGSAAANGNYSYELGSWHVVSLNSDCTNSGCQDSLAGSTSSAEVSWLQSDLAAHPNQCILAYWHHPRFSSGWVGNSPGVGPFWTTLYAAHADVVFNGHDHMYERFAQQDPSQNATSEGIREFVVGTGGESLFSMGTTQPNMQAVDNNHFGALFLTLRPGSYEWAFRATSGSVLDSGSTNCHSQPATKQAATQSAASQPSLSPTAGQLPAVQAAAALAGSASTVEARLEFTARPLPTTLQAAERQGIPVDVHCSRACDVSIAIRADLGGRDVTIASYRETESQIPRPSSRVLLPLSPRQVARFGRVPLQLSFAAVDASNEQQTATSTLALTPR